MVDDYGYGDSNNGGDGGCDSDDREPQLCDGNIVMSKYDSSTNVMNELKCRL